MDIRAGQHLLPLCEAARRIARGTVRQRLQTIAVERHLARIKLPALLRPAKSHVGDLRQQAVAGQIAHIRKHQPALLPVRRAV